MLDQCLDQRRRMLAVAVDEQNGAEPGVIETTGEQRGLLAEIARQRHHLDVEAARGQAAGDGKRAVAAAIVDIDHFAGQRTYGRKPWRDLDQTGMQALERGRFVVERHDNRKAVLGAELARRAAVVQQRCNSWSHHTRHTDPPPTTYSPPGTALSCTRVVAKRD